MAGDWIKMRCDLQTHPKIVRISSALCTDRFRVIGGLHAVWSIFDAHSSDGALDGYTTDAIDSLIGWPGFSAAMQSVGWLIVDAQTIVLPRFDTHNGQSAKRRANDTERKRSDRGPKPVRKLSAKQQDELRTREEKRREEEEQKKELPSSTGEKPPTEPAKTDPPPEPPKPPEPAPVDPDPIFGIGLAFLLAKGVPKNSARSFLGLFRKECGGDLVAVELLTRAEQDDISDPVAWLTKAAKVRKSSVTQLSLVPAAPAEPVKASHQPLRHTPRG